jgi:chromosome segregation ATPase
METKQLTAEEIEQIKAIEARGEEKLFQFGQLEVEILMMTRRLDELHETKSQLQTEFHALRDEEKQLVKQLNSKYGTGQIDIAAGTITYN